MATPTPSSCSAPAPNPGARASRFDRCRPCDRRPMQLPRSEGPPWPKGPARRWIKREFHRGGSPPPFTAFSSIYHSKNASNGNFYVLFVLHFLDTINHDKYQCMPFCTALWVRIGIKEFLEDDVWRACFLPVGVGFPPFFREVLSNRWPPTKSEEANCRPQARAGQSSTGLERLASLHPWSRT